MNMYDLILKKKNGNELTLPEIEWLINNYNNNIIPDYQMSALLMAICFNGMTKNETVTLTKAMMNSGTVLELPHDLEFIVDKHSTGGVGDTTSLIVGPIVAAAGCTVAKMSGRGLGHTGGTIDKLESFPGLTVEIDSGSFVNQLRKIGFAIIGQTAKLAPVDKKLYALRDVTGTIDSIPLIASSIMSKKLAAGSKTIVLDVKVGSGAFMKTLEQARVLANTMVYIGKQLNRKVVAIISDMNYPLGTAIGNILEVKEAIGFLNGCYTPDMYELCLELSSQILLASGKCASKTEAINIVQEMIVSKKALNKLAEMIKMQHGDDSYVYELHQFPKAQNIIDVKSPYEGYLKDIKALNIGNIAMKLGAGRITKGDTIDLTAGVLLYKQVGSFVKKNDIIAQLHSSSVNDFSECQGLLLNSLEFSKDKPMVNPIVLDIIK